MLATKRDQANCPPGSVLEPPRSGGSLKVNVIHPDLGLGWWSKSLYYLHNLNNVSSGGAERLVLDVVNAASSLGHQVRSASCSWCILIAAQVMLYTAHHDERRAFEDTVDAGEHFRRSNSSSMNVTLQLVCARSGYMFTQVTFREVSVENFTQYAQIFVAFGSWCVLQPFEVATQ